MFSSSEKSGTRTIGPGSSHPDPENAELVSPRFLVIAGLATVVAAAICGYLAMCLLFYQGQWQLVLHPAAMQPVPATALPAHEDVRFFPGPSGQPQLHGWFIPSDSDSEYKDDVILYVPDGSGAMSSRVTTLSRLHDLGRGIFTFDYRGFGDSAAMHPSQESMEEDAAAAVEYLTSTRHVPAAKIALIGNGTGAVAAMSAAQQHPDICCVVLDNVRTTMLPVFQADSRTHMLPMRWLLKDEFNLAPLVEQDQHPKLIIATGGSREGQADAHAVYELAAGRKTYADLFSLDAEGKGMVEMRQFLDENLKP